MIQAKAINRKELVHMWFAGAKVRWIGICSCFGLLGEGTRYPVVNSSFAKQVNSPASCWQANQCLCTMPSRRMSEEKNFWASFLIFFVAKCVKNSLAPTNLISVSKLLRNVWLTNTLWWWSGFVLDLALGTFSGNLLSFLNKICNPSNINLWCRYVYTLQKDHVM